MIVIRSWNSIHPVSSTPTIMDSWYHIFIIYHICVVPDVKRLRQAIKDEVERISATLHENVRASMDDFADMLFEKGVISQGIRRSKDYNAIMDEFVNALTFLETVQDCKDHCCKLIDVLTEVGGVARMAGVALSKKWNSSVKVKVGIDFLQ